MEFWCSSSCTRDPAKHDRTLLHDIFWETSDILSNMNHGMSFCPRLASWLFLLAFFNLGFPFFWKAVFRRSPWDIIKTIFLFIFPFWAFQVIWRPYNFLLHFLVTNYVSTPCTEWLPVISFSSSILFLMISCWMTGCFQGLFTKKKQKQPKGSPVKITASKRRKMIGKATVSPKFKVPLPVPAKSLSPRGHSDSIVTRRSRTPSGHSSSNRSKPEFKRTRSGCIYGRWA